MKKLSTLLLLILFSTSFNGIAQESGYQAELNLACECIGTSMDEFLPLLSGWVTYMEAHPGMEADEAMERYISTLPADQRKAIMKQAAQMEQFFDGETGNTIDRCLDEGSETSEIDEMIETEAGRAKLMKYLKSIDCEALTVIFKLAILSDFEG